MSVSTFCFLSHGSGLLSFLVRTMLMTRWSVIEITQHSAQFLVAFAKWRKATTSFMCQPVRSQWNSSSPTGRIFIKFHIWEFFENMSTKSKFYWNLTRLTGTLHEDQYTFLSYLAQFFLEWEMFIINWRKNQNTYFVFNNIFFPRKSCRLWDNVQKYCRTGKATNDNMVHAHCMLDT